MRIKSLFILTILFVACASMVFAQPGGGGRGRGGQGGGPGGMGGGGRGPGGPGGMMGGPMMMGPGMGALFSEDGRKDLGLSEKQVSDIQTAFRETMRPRDGETRPEPPGPDASQEERQKFFNTMRQEMEKRSEATIGKIKTILTKEQLEKAQTRVFQAGGYGSVMMNPLAQDVLGITSEQKEKIRGFQDEQRKEMEANRPDFERIQTMSEEDRRTFFENMRTRAEESRKKMEEKITGILTPEQKAKGEKLLGETPEYIKEARERGPGGPGGRGPGGPDGGRGRGRGGDWQPGANSWQPGQGAGQDEEPQPQRRRFPRRDRD